MHYVYVIKSQISGRYYVGSTSDIDKRIKKHNSGSTKSTKPFRPWVLVHEEQFSTSIDARKRENQIKKYKGGEAFKKLLIRPR